MNQKQYEQPGLFTVKADSHPISGKALLELLQVVLARGAPFRFCARGWSMVPFVRDGDVITITPLNGNLPGNGKIVAFIRPESGNLVVHRVVGRQGDDFLIQGDSGPDCLDGIVPRENLLGAVKSITRNGRRVWLGLGPERFLVAWLSRVGMLVPLRRLFASLRGRSNFKGKNIMSSYVSQGRLPDFSLWGKIADRCVPLDFYLEITARCNNNCSQCYINLPAGDLKARQNELSLEEISHIADQAVVLGAIWCLITGGEPLLRKDFAEIYLALRRKGLLVSLFTNACLVTEDHIALFKKYPPRDIEVTVYGITEETYERVTRQPGSYKAFRRGLEMLLQAGLKVRLKAMAIRSNFHELPEIAAFCRENTMDFFRFDPLLNLRHDNDQIRNEEIQRERLTPAEIVAIEQADEERAGVLEKGCDKLIFSEGEGHQCDHLFHCGAGNGSFTVSYDGIFRLCSALWDSKTTYDLRTGNLAEAWNEVVPIVRELRSQSEVFLGRCRNCPIVNLCLWCPANAHLETGEMDGLSDYFCQVAHARAEAIQNRIKSHQ